jgi:hypothetical protein
MSMLIRPPEAEVPAFFRGYVAAVPSSPGLIEYLYGQLTSFPDLLRQFHEEQTMTGYAAGKWSLKQAIEHVNDTERIFSYRLLRIARGDQTPLPGFEQDEYVARSWANRRPWSELIDEFVAVRHSSLALIRSLPGEAWVRAGTASGAHCSARMFAYVIAGHVAHHTGVVESQYK